jgi:hypothetical protein
LLSGQLDCLPAVFCLADDLDAGLRVEQCGKPARTSA